MTATVKGQCHCGNIAYELAWPKPLAELQARACDCGFCVKHGGVWTSHPQASIAATIREPGAVARYRFGTATADFLVCTKCGVPPLVTCEIEGRLRAVVNVNTFESIDPATIPRASATFDGEDVDNRLARRARNWIGTVRIDEEGTR
jgi:hypothetical protein